MIDLIGPDTLDDWKKTNSVYLIDVREVDEYSIAHIEGAHLIPLSTFEVDQIPKQNKPIVVYCRSGARSMHACMIIKNHFQSMEIYNLEGGILNWERQGYSVKKS